MNLVLDVPATATLLGVSKRKVEHLITSGELRSLRIGRLRRVRMVDVEAYLARRVEIESEDVDVVEVAPEAVGLLTPRRARALGLLAPRRKKNAAAGRGTAASKEVSRGSSPTDRQARG